MWFRPFNQSRCGRLLCYLVPLSAKNTFVVALRKHRRQCVDLGRKAFIIRPIRRSGLFGYSHMYGCYPPWPSDTPVSRFCRRRAPEGGPHPERMSPKCCFPSSSSLFSSPRTNLPLHRLHGRRRTVRSSLATRWRSGMRPVGQFAIKSALSFSRCPSVSSALS